MDLETQHFVSAMNYLAVGNLQAARRSMKLGADAQEPNALAMYALFVEFGIGGRPNLEKALPWFEKAAARGDQPSCIRLAKWCIDSRNFQKAKFWLRKAYPNPRASLLLAELFAKSRSVRATGQAKFYIAHARILRHQLSAKEVEELDLISAEFRNRNPDPMWSRNNQKRNPRSVREVQ